RLVPGGRGIELVGGDQIPIPESVRDAVLLRAAALPERAYDALQVAAVGGLRVDPALLSGLADEEGLEQALESGFLITRESGVLEFRHSLAREAVYSTVPRRRRLVLHRKIADRLELVGARPAELADHLLLAGDTEKGRRALVESAKLSCALHGY